MILDRIFTLAFVGFGTGCVFLFVGGFSGNEDLSNASVTLLSISGATWIIVAAIQVAYAPGGALDRRRRDSPRPRAGPSSGAGATRLPEAERIRAITNPTYSPGPHRGTREVTGVRGDPTDDYDDNGEDGD